MHGEVGERRSKLFYDDCADMGIANKVCIMVWSEFGRRVEQNDNGTDHGSQGPMFVIGGGVQRRRLRQPPEHRPAALYDDGNTVYSPGPGDPFRSTDLRDVYGTILKHWLNMPPTDPPRQSSRSTAAIRRRWTQPNFDMGFL